MMAQNDQIVVGIDVAKDKVDACIRSLSLRQTFPSTAQGHRKLVAWLRKHKVNKAAMEASGGYERDWAKVLRQAGIEVRIVDPKRVRSFALSAGRLAKNDAIDAEMIAWFAETFDEAPSQTHDAAHEELAALVKARKDLIDLKTRLQSQDEHVAPGPVQKAHARVLKSLAAETVGFRNRDIELVMQFLHDQYEAVVENRTVVVIQIISFLAGAQLLQHIVETGQRQMGMLSYHALAVCVEFFRDDANGLLLDTVGIGEWEGIETYILIVSRSIFEGSPVCQRPANMDRTGQNPIAAASS
jgi:transposase